MAWLNILGLLFNLVGSGIAAIGVIASREEIDRTMANLAIIGLSTLCVGFALQIIANWPR